MVGNQARFDLDIQNVADNQPVDRLIDLLSGDAGGGLDGSHCGPRNADDILPASAIITAGYAELRAAVGLLEAILATESTGLGPEAEDSLERDGTIPRLPDVCTRTTRRRFQCSAKTTVGGVPSYELAAGTGPWRNGIIAKRNADRKAEREGSRNTGKSDLRREDGSGNAPQPPLDTETVAHFPLRRVALRQLTVLVVPYQGHEPLRDFILRTAGEQLANWQLGFNVHLVLQGEFGVGRYSRLDFLASGCIQLAIGQCHKLFSARLAHCTPALA